MEIKNLNIIEVSDEEIKKFESQADVSDEKLKEQKEIITRKIMLRNLRACDENVKAFLNSEEKVNFRFKGMTSAMQYLVAFSSYDYYITHAVMFNEFGMYFLIYVTNNRLFIFETTHIYKIQRSYVFKFNEIKKFKFKVKKDCFQFDFKFTNNTNNDMRETYFFYTSYFKNRIIVNSIDKNSQIIADYINKHLKS